MFDIKEWQAITHAQQRRMNNSTNIYNDTNIHDDSSDDISDDSGDDNETNSEELEISRVAEMREQAMTLHAHLARAYNVKTLAQNIRIVDELQHACFLRSPAYFQEEKRMRDIFDGDQNYEWTYSNPNLDDGTGPNSFRAHYRVSRNTFNIIVNTFQNDPEFDGSEAMDGFIYPVWMQVAVVLWRLSNTNFGSTIAKILGWHAPILHEYRNKMA
ncbi:hypothetical protein F4703DRAFT_1932994 [Phycomyces blakesleeanus]